MGYKMVDKEYAGISFFNYTTYNATAFYNVDGIWFPHSYHATQIIWKSTTSIGMGVGAYSMGTPVQSVQLFSRTWYYPAGNVPNQYANNVFPPK